ncbi:MAG: Pyridoxamine 5'-phosphate oxidase [Promethearchaeota archaeon]|nr:MAG: Pyridoxamine 5'-phosphate oxidase [Candidatus Lokiarchaeota archaeon]
MRRKDKEITDKMILTALLNKAQVCRLALSDNNIPYIVPVNFGIQDNCLYIHSAKEGKKMEILKKNDKVCFEIDLDFQLQTAKDPCQFSAQYQSVIGFGIATFINSLDEKIKALNIIMQHYTGKNNYMFKEYGLKKIAIIKIEITKLTGKKSYL